MLTQNWSMRQSEAMTLAISKMMLHKDSVRYCPPGGDSSCQEIEEDLQDVMREYRVELP